MSDMGFFQQEGINRIVFIKKTEEVLKYLHEITKEAEGKDKEILDKASEIITKLAEQKMNINAHVLKDFEDSKNK
ncbi:MAG: hypothetical protein ACTSRZ_07085 [Promethearchaeota archaeon]